jgi:hypothetical protein
VLKLSEVTVELLNQYKRSMAKDGKSGTTVGIYLRSLRAIIKDGIERGTFDVAKYPFGKRRVEIPMGSNVKKALTDDQLTKIFGYIQPLLPLRKKQRTFGYFSPSPMVSI